MLDLSPQLLVFLEIILCSSVIFMQLARKTFTVIFLYSIQSLIIVFSLFYSSFKSGSLLLFGVAILTFLVKVVIAPYFFYRLVKKHKLNFSVSTYLNGPMTLIVVALLMAFSYSNFLSPLTILTTLSNENAIQLAVGMIFISLLLIINRKGVLSQMVGILSLENAIVSFAYVAGLETTVGPQIGILFDILVWIVIAILFASTIYKQFGTLNASAMNNLKE